MNRSVYSLKSDRRFVKQDIQGLQYLGNSVFETMRLRQVGQSVPYIPGFQAHCARFQQGLRWIGTVSPSATFLKDAVSETLADFGLRDSDICVRLLGAPEGIHIILERYQPHSWISGVSLFPQQLSRPFPEFKHGSALISVQSQKAALAEGFDTALLYELDGTITECSWANFFWIDSTGMLCTRNDLVLPGITRGLFESISKVKHSQLQLDTIFAGTLRGAFISQATSGIVPVLRVGEFTFGEGSLLEVEQRVRAPLESAIMQKLVPVTFFEFD